MYELYTGDKQCTLRVQLFALSEIVIIMDGRTDGRTDIDIFRGTLETHTVQGNKAFLLLTVFVEI